ncbi:hypothetical protein B0H17DRAFT_1264894 [Mycena rosella]|uniref:Homeodomain-like protein n=1 Tax=Mycena rosella TaxID=1033263 RepID=A0AAD7MBE2_MYCRO|nr:hypothetical protein B0H17DRAFT_1302383 [Mycena rosella]KAJ7706935.1 hypothetical protein B0H17DRAFT_1287799 [Mycena rosella]KAJ7709052.1 hypothetical protein B0H17DRAFT_1264894 [Mycena rosella]
MAPGNRRHIPEEQKQLVVIMAHTMAPKDIAAATGIHRRTINRILETWRETGKCVRRPLELGRPRILTTFDVSFLEGLVLRTPDIYTFELQQALFVHTGLNVDKDTLRNALIRRGYTRKTVSGQFVYIYMISHCDGDISLSIGGHLRETKHIPS